MPSVVYKYVGNTFSLTVSAVAVSTVVQSPNTENCNFAAFLNVGTTLAAVNISTQGGQNAVFPTAGNPQSGFVLPSAMIEPMIVAVPPTQFTVSAITNSSVAPTLFITPVVSPS